jgi:hypothetical protein
MTVFFGAASALFLAGLIPFLRFLILSFFVGHANSGGHLQSLVAGTVLMIAAFIALALGVIADLIRINRILLEDSLEQQKRQRYATEDLLEIADLDPTWPPRQRAGTG